MLKVAPSAQPERKRVGFLVQTDSAECPDMTYALSVMIYPEWEVTDTPESSRTLPIGRAGRQVMRLVSRRIAQEGDVLPTKVEVDSPLVARFLGEPREQTEQESVTSYVRDVEIALPPSPEPGPQRGSLRLRWPDGHTREQPIVWQVVPVVDASPSKLVLRRSERDLTHTVTVRAFDNRPFRIRDVGPSRLVASCDFDREALPVHTLKLRIDPEGAPDERDSQLAIKTNVDDHPIVSLSIVILPPGV